MNLRDDGNDQWGVAENDHEEIDIGMAGYYNAYNIQQIILL